ncbi:MAG: alkaline phosphatase family protein [Zavarzinella sp.]
MRNQTLLALGAVTTVTFFLLGGIDQAVRQNPKPPAEAAFRSLPTLPGLTEDGYILLSNQWRLRPAGKQLSMGNLPINLAVHPSGQYLAVLHGGMKEHEIIIVNLNPKKQQILSRVTLDQTFYGLTFSPDGRQLYASGGEFQVIHAFDFARGLLGNPREISIASEGSKHVPGGLAMDAKGLELFVCNTWGDSVFRIPVDNPENKVEISLVQKKEQAPAPKKGDPPSPPDGRKEPGAEKLPAKPTAITPENYPYACIVSADGKTLYVSLWASAQVAVIDLTTNTVQARWNTALHPTEMAIDSANNALYVACANSTQVSVLDLKTGASLQTIHCSLYPQSPSGNTPNSLTLLEGGLLLVANADANNLAMFNVEDPKKALSLGFIPTGWYPTSVRFNPKDNKIYVANGKGSSSKSNRHGPNPNQPLAKNLQEYIGTLFEGTLSIIDMHKPLEMAKYTKEAYKCSPLQKDFSPRAKDIPTDNPIPKTVGAPSPIKHVIYIIKENRTYDQVFGDMPEGNGDPTLCLFPEAITPNHHALARQFVLLDNFYVDGEVSADGHEWSMGAYATDFVEKVWPLTYRGSPTQRFGYPSEGALDKIARPAGGYLWDRAAAKNVTYRSYGEWIANGAKRKDGTFEDSTARVKALDGHFDPKFRGYDLDYPDVLRAERFITELKEFEQKGEYPQLTILRLPNDHTSGTRVGKPTPTAQVADNDLALGMVVEAVSKSKFWPETAIFVIEDDAQNGPDHVDAHRVVALAISPYTKKNYVDSTMYSTSSMLRTMELILGLDPMSQFDAAAMPMYHSFQAKPDVAPYKHLIPKTDLKATNEANAWGAKWSERANLEQEDAADDILFNEVIWKSVRGANSRMPAPVRAAFFRGKPEDDDDDDE